MQGGGEAAAVRVSAGPGLGGLHHDRPQGAAEHEHGPHLLLDADGPARAEHAALPEGVPQREVCGLVLPALVAEGGQGSGEVAASVGQGGGEARGAREGDPVLAGHGDGRFDDADKGRYRGRTGRSRPRGRPGPGRGSWRGSGPGTGRRYRPPRPGRRWRRSPCPTRPACRGAGGAAVGGRSRSHRPRWDRTLRRSWPGCRSPPGSSAPHRVAASALRSQPDLTPVALGDLDRAVPGKETVRNGPNCTPRAVGRASGPASTSNRFRIVAIRRRRAFASATRSAALPLPAPRSAPAAPAGSRPPETGTSRHEYTPTRVGRSRSRRCTVNVSSRTAPASSKGSTRVSSPRRPGANRPPATVNWRATVARPGGEAQ